MEFILRAIYFILFGWWLGLLWYVAAYILCLSVIGLPLGVFMLNRIPQVLTLKPVERMKFISSMRINDRIYPAVEVPKEELPFILRVLYFFVAGWWIAGLIGEFAFVLCLTIIGIPFGLYLFNRIPLFLTLKQIY